MLWLGLGTITIRLGFGKDHVHASNTAASCPNFSRSVTLTDVETPSQTIVSGLAVLWFILWQWCIYGLDRFRLKTAWLGLEKNIMFGLRTPVSVRKLSWGLQKSDTSVLEHMLSDDFTEHDAEKLYSRSHFSQLNLLLNLKNPASIIYFPSLWQQL